MNTALSVARHTRRDSRPITGLRRQVLAGLYQVKQLVKRRNRLSTGEEELPVQDKPRDAAHPHLPRMNVFGINLLNVGLRIEHGQQGDDKKIRK